MRLTIGFLFFIFGMLKYVIFSYEMFFLQISLFDHDSEKCSFKILPRYKLKSLEDQVLYHSTFLYNNNFKGHDG